MTTHLHVNHESDAWTLANSLTPCDYCYDSTKTERSGYAVYFSVNPDISYFWIDNLGDRLEVNLPDRTYEIWIDSKRIDRRIEKTYNLDVSFIGSANHKQTVTLENQKASDFYFWKTVESTEEIVDNETGEILFSRIDGINQDL